MNQEITNAPERSETVFFIGQDNEGNIEELKKGLGGILIEEWSCQGDIRWKEEFEMRSGQSSTDRTEKVYIIRNIENFLPEDDLLGFLNEAPAWGCGWWIVGESLKGIDSQIFMAIAANVRRVVVGEIDDADREVAKKYGWLKN